MANSKIEKIRNEIERTRTRARERDRQIELEAEAIRERHMSAGPQSGARVICSSPIEELLLVAEGKAPLPPSFTKFIALWEAFNCWLRIPSEGSGKRVHPKDRDLITDFKDNTVVQGNFRKLLKDSPEYKQALANLKNLSPVYRVQGISTTNSSVKIDNETDLAETMDVVYQIRCNLFHGAKSLYDHRDQELVAAAHEVLLPLFKQLLNNSRATHHSMKGE